jgi:hypothetical protein
MSNNFKINLKGFIYANLDSVSGYTIEHALVELFHNSQDAKANTILFYFEKDGDDHYINVIDNGRGMDYSEITNMNILYNHQEKGDDCNHGTFGFGAKGAMLCVGGQWIFLSKKKNENDICKLFWDVEKMKDEVTLKKNVPELDSSCIKISDESGPKNTQLFLKYMSLIESKHGTIARCKLPYSQDQYYEIKDFEEQLKKTMDKIQFKNNNECKILFLNRTNDKDKKIKKLQSFDPLDYINTIDSRKTTLTIYGRMINRPNPYPEFYITDKDGNCFKYKQMRSGVSSHFEKGSKPKNLYDENIWNKLTAQFAVLSHNQVMEQRNSLKRKAGVDFELSGIFINRNKNFIYTDSSCWSNVLKHMGKNKHLFSANCASTGYGDIIRGARCVLSYNKTKNCKVFDMILGAMANKSSFSIESVNIKFKNMFELIVNSMFIQIRNNWKKRGITIIEDRFLEEHSDCCNIPSIISNILTARERQEKLEKQRNFEEEKNKRIKIEKLQAKEKEASERKVQEERNKRIKIEQKVAEDKEQHRKNIEKLQSKEEASEQKTREAERKTREAERKVQEERNKRIKIEQQVQEQKSREKKTSEKVEKSVNQTEEKFKKIVHHNMEKVHKDMMNNHLTDPKKKRKLAEINVLLEDYIILG